MVLLGPFGYSDFEMEEERKNNRILNSILVWLGADFGEVQVFWEARFALPISASE